MNRLKSIFTYISGDVEQTGSERYFVTVTCFVASVFLMILSALHLIINLKLAPIFIACGSSLVLLGLYFLIRFTNYVYFSKFFLTFFGLIMLDFAWYTKYLSFGPILYFIIIFGALIIWVWEGKSLAIILILYFLNIGILFTIDYNAADFLFIYPNQKIRSLDIFSSYLVYSSLMIFLLYIVKREFIRQKEKAEKSDKLKSAFLTNMSHEIRTPINAICGFTELLEKETDPIERSNFINIVQRSSDNLLKLVNEIIDLSKIEAGYFQLNPSSFSIEDLFIELKEIYSIKLKEKNKTSVIFEFDLPQGNFIIKSDLIRLKQIISNLVSNAIKFTQAGRIKLSCIKRNKMLIFRVVDTGTGIPEEDQKRIFDRFIRYNYEDMNIDGSGIGLSIVEKIVSLFEGRVWLKSKVGEGSCFYFSIPYVKSTIMDKPVKKTFISDLDSIEQKKQILVVEDDSASSLLISKFLEAFNYEIHQVGNGKDAIEFVKSNSYTDLILMDIKLPGMDGYETTLVIKEINPNIPIIAQTAYAILGEKEKAIGYGCDDYITKPIKLNELHKKVDFYLSKKQN